MMAGACCNKQKQETHGKGVSLDDDYMMYTYKVIPCSRASTHNWKLCHYSHVGEVAARRRHPSLHQADQCAYISANKECPNGDNCTYAHNAFESWLHPDRYKTTLCSYAGACTRKFCFFAHSPSELRTPKQGELRLPKTTSLDTAGSVGTPNSSSSNNSSGSMVQALQPNWAAATASGLGAAGTHPGGMYIHSANSSAAAAMHAAGLNGSMRFYPTSMQPQQQLLAAAGMDGGSSLLPPGTQSLSAIVVTAPQMSPAAALPMPIAGTLPGTGMQAMQGMQFWDDAALAAAGKLLPAGLGSSGTPMTADGSSYTTSFLFDPASPSTPLTVASGSPMHSPLMPLAAAPGSSSSNQQLSVLQQTLDCSSQQQNNGQLHQQLLQHLANVQQQSQQQQYQQQYQQQGSSSYMHMGGQAWSLGSEPLNPHMAAMFNLHNPHSLHAPLTTVLSAATAGGSPSGMSGSMGGAAAAQLSGGPGGPAAAAAGGWSHLNLQGDQQQLQQQAGGYPIDVKVLPGPRGFRPVGIQGSAMPGELGGLTAPGAAGGNGDASQQQQQQINMFTYAMVQPA